MCFCGKPKMTSIPQSKSSCCCSSTSLGIGKPRFSARPPYEDHLCTSKKLCNRSACKSDCTAQVPTLVSGRLGCQLIPWLTSTRLDDHADVQCTERATVFSKDAASKDVVPQPLLVWFEQHCATNCNGDFTYHTELILQTWSN